MILSIIIRPFRQTRIDDPARSCYISDRMNPGSEAPPVKTLLITGFEPFGGETVNPSWEAVRLLPDQVGNWAVSKLQIPVIYGLAGERVLEEANRIHPDVILCIGQAGGRAGVTPEAVGLNLRDAQIPDNNGNQPVAQPIVKDGPVAYFATVPVRSMVRAMTNARLPSSLSLSAGAFVCNDVLYTLLHHYAGTSTRVGFIHVPFLPEQANDGVPSMKLEDMVRALTICVETLDEEQ